MQHKVGDPWPKGRSHHIAVCLGYGGQHKTVLISGGVGGFRASCKVHGDMWLLDPASGTWKEVRIIVVLYSELQESVLSDGIYKFLKGLETYYQSARLDNQYSIFRRIRALPIHRSTSERKFVCIYYGNVISCTGHKAMCVYTCMHAWVF